MLGHSFDDVYNNATLQWRFMFAKHVLKLELLAEPVAAGAGDRRQGLDVCAA